MVPVYKEIKKDFRLNLYFPCYAYASWVALWALLTSYLAAVRWSFTRIRNISGLRLHLVPRKVLIWALFYFSYFSSIGNMEGWLAAFSIAVFSIPPRSIWLGAHGVLMSMSHCVLHSLRSYVQFFITDLFLLIADILDPIICIISSLGVFFIGDFQNVNNILLRLPYCFIPSKFKYCFRIQYPMYETTQEFLLYHRKW